MSVKRRILVATTRAERGGAPKHVVDLTINLKDKYDICLVIGEEGYVVDEVRRANIPVHIIPSLQRDISPIKDLLTIREFLRVVKSFQPDIIHGHTFKAGAVSRIAAFVHGIPSIYTPHGWNFADGAPRLWRIVVPPVEKALSALADAVICVSYDEKRLAERRRVVTSKKIAVIHNGIEDDANRARPGVPVTPVTVVMVARFIPPKTQEVLIRASVPLGQRVRVWLIGDGPQQVSARELVSELGLTSVVEFLGIQDKVAEIISNAQIFVLSTDWEGLPLSVLEAMRAGLPVIASNVGGISEALENNVSGFLVPPRDIHALQDALNRLVDSPNLRETMGRAGRERYERDFLLERQIQKTIAVYESVLNKKPSRRFGWS